MDVKFGKLSANFFSGSNTGSNFFAEQKTVEIPDFKNDLPNSSRINDFDSNILENNAYLEISDEMFKLEHKIELLEAKYSKIVSEIEALDSLGEMIQMSELKLKKLQIEQDLNILNEKYSNLNLSSKLSGQIVSAIGLKRKRKSPIKSMIFNNVKSFLAKIFKKFGFNEFMKESLYKLSNINSNVDELINMQIPYGEKIPRYEKLIAYLNKANSIHYQISKNMKSIK